MVAIILALASWLALASAAWAQDVQPVPALTGRVIDQTGTLSANDIKSLNDQLAAFEAEAGPQIVVLMLASTAPEDIAAYAYRVADQWKIGRRDVGDGVLLIVAKDDRRVRIEVAKALEGAIPDLAARQIIDRAIAPAFRQGRYAVGLQAAVEQIEARIRGEHLPAPTAKGSSSSRPGLQLQELLMFFFIGVPVVGALLTGMLGRKLGALATAGVAGGAAWLFTASVLLAVGVGVVAIVVIGVMGIGSAMNGGRSRAVGRRGRRAGTVVPPIIWGGGGGGFGGGGGGFGGGGFSSGGGGDFGGGGASGDW